VSEGLELLVDPGEACAFGFAAREVGEGGVEDGAELDNLGGVASAEVEIEPSVGEVVHGADT
jgi:hypothetical protein